MKNNQAWVSKNTDPSKLAASILIQLKNNSAVDVVALNHETVFIQSKALCLLQMFLERECIIADFKPGMQFQTDKNNKQRTATVWTIRKAESN